MAAANQLEAMAAIKHLIVTFDVPKAKPGDRRYKAVDDLLLQHGPVIKVFKQVRLLTTKSIPSRLTRLITQIVGVEGSVMICHASRPYRFVLGNSNPNAHQRASIENWFRSA